MVSSERNKKDLLSTYLELKIIYVNRNLVSTVFSYLLLSSNKQLLEHLLPPLPGAPLHSLLHDYRCSILSSCQNNMPTLRASKCSFVVPALHLLSVGLRARIQPQSFQIRRRGVVGGKEKWQSQIHRFLVGHQVAPGIFEKEGCSVEVQLAAVMVQEFLQLKDEELSSSVIWERKKSFYQWFFGTTVNTLNGNGESLIEVENSRHAFRPASDAVDPLVQTQRH